MLHGDTFTKSDRLEARESIVYSLIQAFKRAQQEMDHKEARHSLQIEDFEVLDHARNECRFLVSSTDY